MIIYLHGFRSSPQSFKARMLQARMAALGLAADYQCPHLPASPAQAVQMAMQLAQQYLQTNPPGELTLIGSSLGGYYATWMAEQLGCRAVLLNPAVQPPRELEKYVGVTTEYNSDRPFEFKHEYIAELAALAIAHISKPERYFLIAATGDEVLDWHEMLAHYPRARHRLIQGSDHGLSDFARYRDEVLTYCGAKA